VVKSKLCLSLVSFLNLICNLLNLLCNFLNLLSEKSLCDFFITENINPPFPPAPYPALRTMRLPTRGRDYSLAKGLYERYAHPTSRMVVSVKVGVLRYYPYL